MLRVADGHRYDNLAGALECGVCLYRARQSSALHCGAKMLAFARAKNNNFPRERNGPRGYYVSFDESFQSGSSPLRGLDKFSLYTESGAVLMYAFSS